MSEPMNDLTLWPEHRAQVALHHQAELDLVPDGFTLIAHKPIDHAQPKPSGESFADYIRRHLSQLTEALGIPIDQDKKGTSRRS